MVMMEKPSPIQVGREFVRQYYTLLNKAPALLHRFYNVNSSYVHGGKYCEGEPEEPIIGQSEIYHKIESLNFNDCHTKIRQVDALSTLSDGVVVQVTGELSNGGQPLRRFMQTFVLGPQGDNPFKFYVRNDIFRYQDEVFTDSQGEPSDDDDQAVPEEEPVELPKEPEPEEEEEPPEDPAPMTSYQENLYQPPMPNHALDQTPALTNGLEQSPEVDDHDQKPPSPQTIEPSNPPPVSNRRTPTPTDFRQTPEPEPIIETKLTPQEPVEHVKEPEICEPKVPPKPFSWADMASKNTPAPRTNVLQSTVVKPNRVPEQQTDAGTVEPPQRQQRVPRNNQRRDDDRGGGFGDRSDRRGPGRDSIRYPDNQQIFVGNLPYDIDENELKEHFSGFGQVVEVKINHSQTNNPSFGFVIFKDPKAVDNVLRVMPTQYKNQYRINIEEKKQRNTRDGVRRGGDSRRGGMGESRGGRRGPPPNMRRDRQGSREGPRPNGPPRR